MSHQNELSEEVAQHRRTGWLPVVEETDDELSASKFGGRPWLSEDEQWPTCANCEQPLQHFVQLDLAALPEAEQERLGDTGLLQVFYCTNTDPLCEVECAAWGPYADSIVARRVEAPTGPANVDAAGPDEPIAARRIVDWEPIEEYPDPAEWSVTFTDEDIAYLEEHEIPARGDKLGGWPHWLQGDEYPSCSECDERMQFVMHIDSNQNVPYSFGGGGMGYLAQCAAHPDVLAFWYVV